MFRLYQIVMFNTRLSTQLFAQCENLGSGKLTRSATTAHIMPRIPVLGRCCDLCTQERRCASRTDQFSTAAPITSYHISTSRIIRVWKNDKEGIAIRGSPKSSSLECILLHCCTYIVNGIAQCGDVWPECVRGVFTRAVRGASVRCMQAARGLRLGTITSENNERKNVGNNHDKQLLRDVAGCLYASYWVLLVVSLKRFGGSLYTCTEIPTWWVPLACHFPGPWAKRLRCKHHTGHSLHLRTCYFTQVLLSVLLLLYKTKILLLQHPAFRTWFSYLLSLLTGGQCRGSCS